MTETWDPDKTRLTVARELREIVRLWRMLPEEAEADHDDREFPGGDALVLLGPVANLEAWEHRYEAAERRAVEAGEAFDVKRGGADYAADQLAELHPLLVLATWEDIVRDERDQPTDLRATVERAADYLGKSIDWMLSYDDHRDMRFIAIDAMASELVKCRRMLEDVLTAGDRAEVSRVWCTDDAHRDGEKFEEVRLHYQAGASITLDRWVCPECKARYDYDEFISARRINLHAKGAERFVLVADAEEATEAPKQTVRSWMRRLTVRSACDIKTRRLMVWWPDVRDADVERQKRDTLKRARQSL